MMENAQTLVGQATSATLSPESYRVDHFFADERLAATLLFYAVLARRHGRTACRNFLPQEGSLFFTDALSLVVDGFDAPFIRKWMKSLKATLLADMRRKMLLSTDLVAALGEKMPFEEMRFLVRSHIR